MKNMMKYSTTKKYNGAIFRVNVFYNLDLKNELEE